MCECPANHYAVIKPTISEDDFALRTFPHIKVQYIHKITQIPDAFEIVNVNNLHEVTGFVHTIISPRTCGNNGQFQKMVFTLNNDQGSILHITVWQEEIPRIEKSLILNSIVNISGAEVSNIKAGYQNKGNQPFQLTIRKNTIVTCLQEERPMPQIQKEEVHIVNLENMKNEEGRLIVEGYIKSPIRLLKYRINNELIHYGTGSLTNGKFKIEIRVKNFPEDVDEFNQGDHVRVEGLAKFTKEEKVVYVELCSTKGIQILDEKKMTLDDNFEGYIVIQKET
ncbi:uncharacterized protein LOC122509769 [Leptopilina heterotoma]|uniref:uncharacterized protein LOC122509769 n=1 Tax=Leptopilina heterotoma TaxID=63436 RepID=UPI001CA81F28|nr:uncharacterized protein LOC122509769 [Leptopilina heterotoma]